ncbi:elongation factor P maturation arginine rhamnosyltransferase EarP [Halothiobacillus sp. DCM-1]|uniref:elongation factor P maturation arginine rhamnosyltransferase EarP n=1 Tax=Halothiobacillus sp. DCM-1 TaxID=3112558 RepID=UPI00324DAB52
MKQNWHLFCRVVDNFGDIGVSWRLATCLHARGESVTLIVDDLARWQAIAGNDIPPAIAVIPWQEPLPPPAECVVEAFGCGLPEAYRAAMPGRTRHWFVLDYFSAESWVPGCHGLSSPQANGLTARFIYPSVLPGTGGLLREQWFEEEQRAAAQAHGWRNRWQIPAPQGDAVFLFGYEQAVLHALLEHWAHAPSPRTAYFAAGRLLDDARRQLRRPLREGQTECWGNLRLIALPFVPQREFDRLLWPNWLNIVRGEDSLTRALWAGKPFIWQIYPTEDDAHWPKLEALMAALSEGLPPAAKQAWRQVNLDWNAQSFHPAHWLAFEAAYPQLSTHFAQIPQRLRTLPELSDTLLRLAQP